MTGRVSRMSGTLACFTLVFGTLAAGCGAPAKAPAAPPEAATSAPKAEQAAAQGEATQVPPARSLSRDAATWLTA